MNEQHHLGVVVSAPPERSSISAAFIITNGPHLDCHLLSLPVSEVHIPKPSSPDQLVQLQALLAALLLWFQNDCPALTLDAVRAGERRGSRLGEL